MKHLYAIALFTGMFFTGMFIGLHPVVVDTIAGVLIGLIISVAIQITEGKL